MKIGKLNICDIPYQVYVEEKCGDHDELAGQIRHYENKIIIKGALVKRAAIPVLGHEIAHGVMVEGGSNEAFTDQQKEVVCDIAGKVAEILFNNKSVAEKLIKSVGK